MDYVALNLADECPEIGCGHRHVLVVSLTERHATILEPSSGSRATMTRESGAKYHGFDELARGTILLPYDPERLVQRLVANSRINGCYDALVRDACVTLGAQLHELPPLAGEAQAGARPGPVAASDPDSPEHALPGEKIGHFVERQIMSRREPRHVVALAKASFPTCKVNLAHVQWYSGKLRKRLGAEEVPAWPREAFK